MNGCKDMASMGHGLPSTVSLRLIDLPSRQMPGCCGTLHEFVKKSYTYLLKTWNQLVSLLIFLSHFHKHLVFRDKQAFLILFVH